MGDQDHHSLFSSIRLKNIDNQTPIVFDQATPSKTMTTTTKSASSIIEKESYENKKCDQLATNHLKQELLHEIKHYISSLQQNNKIGYMDEYIKAMRDQIASRKSEVMFLRWEVKQKNAFIEQLNNNNNNNNNIINRNNNSNNNNDDDSFIHKTSDSPPNISNKNNSSNILNGIDNDNNNNNNSNIINKNNNINNNNDDNNILHKISDSPPIISNDNNSSNVLRALIMIIIIIIIMIIMIKIIIKILIKILITIIEIITKIVKFFLIIDLHSLKIIMVRL